ncbi:MAG: ArnT family glycosyltransferase [Acidobacteriota bacterium]
MRSSAGWLRDAALLTAATLFLVAPPPSGATPAISQVPVVTVPGGGGGQGEIAFFDARGQVVKRFVGFTGPLRLAPAGLHSFLVIDQGADELREIDETGVVLWSWRFPPDVPSLLAASVLSSGNILVAADQAGVLEVDRKGAVVWRAPSPIPGHPVAGAVRCPDGSTVLVVRDRRHVLFRVPRGGSVAEEVPLPPPVDHSNLPGCFPWKPDGSEWLLWDNDWELAYRLALESGRVRVLATLPAWRWLTLVPDDLGGVVYTAENFVVGDWRAGQSKVLFKTVFEPTGAVPVSSPEGYAVSYVRVPNASWPESGPKPSVRSTISWPRFGMWIAAALGIVAVLQVLARRRVRSLSSAPGTVRDGASDVSTPSGSGALLSSWRSSRTTALATAATTAAGFAVAAHGQALLVGGERPGWLWFYVSGALVAAGALEFWRRGALHAHDPFWAAAIAARPALHAWREIAAGAVLVTLGCVLLFAWRRGYSNYTDQVGLWVSLLVVMVGVAALPASGPARRMRRWWRDGAYLALPIAVALVTLFYRLSDVPAYIHFDFVLNATSAWDLMLGRHASIWENGFVPAPVVGLVPEVIGLALAGPGELGFRLGGALFGLSGIVAVFLLASCYRDRRTGLLAALFLAGSIPFVHFSRLNANGDAATAGLWTVTLFALAVKHARPGLWIASGLAAGYCFYLWPGARVAVVACALIGPLLALRSPRAAARRWYGPPLMALGLAVWIVPLLPIWLDNPTFAFPRAEESLDVFKPSEGVHWDRVASSFGAPLAKSFGWFFVTPDNSTQGSLSPACNDVEAVVLAVGIVIVAVEGFSLNVVLAGYVGLVLLTLGAWGGSPPWYTRLVPTAPIAAVFIARAVVGALDLFALAARRVRRIALGVTVAAVIFVSPVANFVKYERYETGRGAPLPTHELVAIGRRLHALGPDYHFYMVTTKRSDWNLDFSMPNGQLAELLPFIWNLHVSEIRELSTSLPLPGNEHAAIVVQGDRLEEDATEIRRFYPDAKVERILGNQGELVAGLVMIPFRRAAAGPRIDGVPDD